ncbi:Cell wall-associated hydrolase, NlpC family [Paramicrobacterium humi]|uniref:Cell wall-associated hydrolase, NlpC family n=1 Tax=Paramicrobacterium humi TaxID=640635 RepID=A0A1H4NTZ2_9MICO|nr:C40 family peptidase [Microbacterium humi]SEB98703.1 Cell wall-associated hydrolase, NlpC family [Microbacterium humi]
MVNTPSESPHTTPLTPTAADGTPLTRRSRRHAQHRTPAVATPRRATTRPPARTAPASSKVATERSLWQRWRSTIVMMIVVPALFGMFALPGSFAPASQAAPLFDDAAPSEAAASQSLNVSADAAPETMERASYSATSQGELDAAAAAKAKAEREANAAKYASYSGPTAADNLANAPHADVNLAAVFAKAKTYQGVPYVYGGATPAGFDCSGFVMYVYSQFGVSLPHSVTGQAAAGTRISAAEAQPGDVVIMNGHDGFYAGNGMILDAPKPGGHVSIRALWTSDYYIVRF